MPPSGNVRAVAARPTRRSVVVAGLSAAGAAAAGCSLGEPGRAPEASDLPGGPGRSQADADLQTRVIAAERRLVAGCEEALRRHPDLDPVLRPVIADHAAHLHALGAKGAVAPDRSSRTAVPQSARRALADLAAAELAAAEARVADCVAARSGPFARLLAAVGAAEAQHAALLTGA